MFARHSTTRSAMKNSDVVQGLKSLAAKIHPQLPLTARESQRLLTALTGSFRQHLDEVHPRNVDETTQSTTSSTKTAPFPSRKHAIHSSAALADKHLASVLTNPLLTQNSKPKPGLDYGTAAVELQKSPNMDPIELLERYHKHRAATVGIAELCMQTFKRSIDTLSAEEQQARIMAIQAGRRVLLWLLNAYHNDFNPWADNHALQNMLVELLVQEGREESVWTWLGIDAPLDVSAASLQKHDPRLRSRKEHIARYRWRGRILKSLVDYKVVCSPKSLRPALDVLLRAYDFFSKLQSYTLPELTLLEPAAHVSFIRALYKSHDALVPADASSLDRLIRMVENDGRVSDRSVGWHRNHAILCMSHPLRPDIDSAYGLLCRLMSPCPDQSVKQHLRHQEQKSRDKSLRTSWIHFFVRTVAGLIERGRLDEARRARIGVNEVFPDYNPHFEINLQKRLEGLEHFDGKWVPMKTNESEDNLSQTPRIPFPAFT